MLTVLRTPYSKESLERLQYKARSFRGNKIYSNYKQNPKGKHPDDVFDIQPIMPSSKQRLGYPTQKPLTLLQRIIKASSNIGDIVFDPFCGCATTLVVAEALQRQWIGIDISPLAAELVVERIEKMQGFWKDITIRTDIPQRTDLGNLPPYNSSVNKTKLYGEQSGYCKGCYNHFEKNNLQLDHIISKKKGGTDHIDNLQLLCGHCNATKGDRGMEYLQKKIKDRREMSFYPTPSRKK